MTATTQEKPAARLVKTALIALCAMTLPIVFPDVTLPGFTPNRPTVRHRAPDPDGLRTLLDGLHLSDATAPAVRPDGHDGHAVRLAVTGYRVRLAVDPTALHPLAGPVAVRPSRLGTPGKSLRRVHLAMVEPTAAPPTTPPAAVSPSPARPTALPRANRPAPAPKPVAAAPAVRPQAPVVDPGRRVLVAGDSLSIFLAQALRPLLAGRPGTNFTAKGKVSSGLARPDFFDWEQEMRRLSTEVRPDTVGIMIAANDDKTMTRPDGSRVAFGRPGWDAEYARRVRRLVELARLGNPQARITWVGSPVMADPRLNADVAAINAVIRRQIERLPGCRFVDVSRTLADTAGRYTPTMPSARGPRPARTRDGVHVTPYGARLLADACLAAMSPTVAALSRP